MVIFDFRPLSTVVVYLTDSNKLMQFSLIAKEENFPPTQKDHLRTISRLLLLLVIIIINVEFERPTFKAVQALPVSCSRGVCLALTASSS